MEVYVLLERSWTRTWIVARCRSRERLGGGVHMENVHVSCVQSVGTASF